MTPDQTVIFDALRSIDHLRPVTHRWVLDVVVMK